VWESVEVLPQVDRWGNFAVNAEVGLDVAISTKWSLKPYVQDNYVHEPAPGRRTTMSSWLSPWVINSKQTGAISPLETNRKWLSILVEGRTRMAVSHIVIPLHDTRLEGTLDLPDEGGSLVIFAHGAGSSRNSPRNRFVASILRQAGLGTLLFDLLTEEEEQAEAFTRHFRFDIQLLANRLVAATRWVLGQLSNGVRAGYFGSSTGAAAALVAATEMGESIGGIVSRGGRPDLAGDALKRVAAPTLLIVAAMIFGHSLNEDAFEDLACEKALQVVAGATHLFEEPGALKKVGSLARDWFCRHLQPVPQGLWLR